MFDSAKHESLKSPNTKVVPNILLQLSQWATYALLNSLSRKSLQSLGFSRFGHHCFQGFD
jgi:hypothetical protein